MYVGNIIYREHLYGDGIKKYDGTKESVTDKSHKPLSKHPTAHTDEEIKWIKDLIKRNPHITLNEIWYKLKINKGYRRKPTSLYSKD